MLTLEEAQMEHVARAIELADTMREAADILDISVRTLYRYKKRLDAEGCIWLYLIEVDGQGKVGLSRNVESRMSVLSPDRIHMLRPFNSVRHAFQLETAIINRLYMNGWTQEGKERFDVEKISDVKEMIHSKLV